VATILDRATPNCIDDWFVEVQRNSGLKSGPLTREQRCGHLPQLFCDLVVRLRADIAFGIKGPLSTLATPPGISRRRLGYTAAMMVVESGILQVSIVDSVEKNLDSINSGVLLRQVMTIADEVDWWTRNFGRRWKCYVERGQSTIRFLLDHDHRSGRPSTLDSLRIKLRLGPGSVADSVGLHLRAAARGLAPVGEGLRPSNPDRGQTTTGQYWKLNRGLNRQ
jgi:hypothetical protein